MSHILVKNMEILTQKIMHVYPPFKVNMSVISCITLTHVITSYTLTFSLILPLSLLSRLLVFKDELLTTGTGSSSSSPHQSELRTQPI